MMGVCGRVKSFIPWPRYEKEDEEGVGTPLSP
jgi:hypothetical protein